MAEVLMMLGLHVPTVLLSETAILPARQTPGASGLDLHADIQTPLVVLDGQRARVPTGIAMAIPEGYEGQVRPRSGLTLRGLTVHLGTIDSDYRGEIAVIVEGGAAQGDESEPVRIKPGDRIAQIVIVPVVRALPALVSSLPPTERGEGGFGSTGLGGAS